MDIPYMEVTWRLYMVRGEMVAFLWRDYMKGGDIDRHCIADNHHYRKKLQR